MQRTHARLARAAALTVTGLCGLAHAGETVELTIDSGQSEIDFDATLMTALGDRTDSAFSTISGSIVIELDDYGVPASITLHDFEIVVDDDLDLSFSYGFLGSADATLSDVTVAYAPSFPPAGPVGISGDAFAFDEVPAGFSGAANGSYSFIGIGSDTINADLADVGVLDIPIDGDVVSDGATVTLSGSFVLDVTQTLLKDVADLSLVGAATIVATGDAPEPAGCNDADLAEPYGVLDLADISTFVSAFTGQDAAADLAAPFGVWDLADISGFIDAFTAGCP